MTQNTKSLRALLLLLSGLLTLTACEQTVVKPSQPATLDPGKHQSPINILTSTTKHEFEDHHFVIHFQDKVNAVENLGHTVQLDFAQGSTISANGMDYEFKQMHFHTPSEHHIDGISYPMEMHIVSIDERTETPYYLVVAILFKMGQENLFINEFLSSIPKNEHGKVKVETGHIKLNDLMSLDADGQLGHHYYYTGSLTTPPYSENVSWLVMKKIFEASPEQIKAIYAIEGDNARHDMPMNGREVEDD